MLHFHPTKLLSYVAAVSIILLSWVIAPVAQAYDNPDLLPQTYTPIIDLADSLTEIQEQNLAQQLNEFEAETGWKLRVLTQFDRTPGRAVKEFWGLDDRSVMLVADPRGGNLLNFSVGDALFELLPRTFWIELQTRYGNQFFVRDNGEDASILEALGSLEGCLRQGGCQVVPGLPREQWILRVCGSAARTRQALLVAVGADLLAAVGHSVHCLWHWAGGDPHNRLATVVSQHCGVCAGGVGCLLISDAQRFLDVRDLGDRRLKTHSTAASQDY
jgi:hypothetical protein